MPVVECGWNGEAVSDSVRSQDGGGHRGPFRLSLACGQSRGSFENFGILSGTVFSLGVDLL